MTSQSVEIVSASFNLTKALADVYATNSLVAAGTVIRDWLLLENVDRGLFTGICELARDLAHPNKKGFELQQRIDAAERSMVQRLASFPIRLAVNGSLGRLISHDDGLAYLVTTVTSLVQYRSIRHATDVICTILKNRNKRGHENGEQARYHFYDASFDAAAVKIVESIYLNVCNISEPSHQPQLPAAFRVFEGRQRTLAASTFAAVVQTIQSSDEDVFIRSENFFADLALWLCYHFNGKIKVTENARVLVDEICGEGSRVVYLLIASSETGTGDRGSNQNRIIDGSVGTDPSSCSYRTVLNDSSVLTGCCRSYSRKPFGKLDGLIQDSVGLEAFKMADIESWGISYNASLVLDWILTLPAKLDKESRLLQFDLDLFGDECNDPEWIELSRFFACTPKLLQTEAKLSTSSIPVFESRRAATGPGFDKEDTLKDLLVWFPKLAMMMREIQKCCRCIQCRRKDSLDECKPGCLRDEALTRFLLHLAHGLSDAMGGKDVSGGGDILDQKELMFELLCSIARLGQLQWDKLFALVAGVVSGVHTSTVFPEDIDDSSSLVATQNGSFVVVARWLNLNKRRDKSQVFALDVVQGANIVGVTRNIAVLRSEGATVDENHLESPAHEHAGVSMDTDDVLTLIRDPDTIRLVCNTAVFHIEDNEYRFLTLVDAGRFMRNVDVTLALLGYLSSLDLECEHNNENQEMLDQGDRQIVVEDFDRGLGTWGFESPSGVVQTTKTLMEPLKINSILSASPEGCIIREAGRCCFACALNHLRDKPMRFANDDYKNTQVVSVSRIVNVGSIQRGISFR